MNWSNRDAKQQGHISSEENGQQSGAGGSGVTNAFAAGFRDLEQTVENQTLPAKGAIPVWLDGHFLRNGPAIFEVGGRRYNHWFDGLAMLHRFGFNNGVVSYTNRFLDSRNYRGVKAKGRMVYDQFSTNPDRGFFTKLIDTLDFSLQLGDNNLVSFGKFAGDLVALGETPTPISIDSHSIATKGRQRLRGAKLTMVTVAHPTYDSKRKSVFSYSVRALPVLSRYVVWQMPYDSNRRRTLCTIKPRLGQPSYMHSLGATENHLILAEFPLLMSPAKLFLNVLTDSPFITNYSWKPDLGTRFLVINKDTGQTTATLEADPFFAFHHVNAWEEGGEIVLDIAAYSDAAVIQNTYLDTLLGPHGGNLSWSTLRRYRLPMKGAGRIDSWQALSEPAFEMPWVHPKLGGRPYRYAYGYGFENSGNLNDCLFKIDVQDSDTANNYVSWNEDGCYPSEGVFVPRPDGSVEDDGVVLSLVFDSRSDESFLLILDATSFDEIARAPTPFPIPFGLHGAYNDNFSGPPPT
jgi:beta,beta-carotene 9',10'-dioxygenase